MAGRGTKKAAQSVARTLSDTVLIVLGMLGSAVELDKRCGVATRLSFVYMRCTTCTGLGRDDGRPLCTHSTEPWPGAARAECEMQAILVRLCMMSWKGWGSGGRDAALHWERYRFASISRFLGPGTFVDLSCAPLHLVRWRLHLSFSPLPRLEVRRAALKASEQTLSPWTMEEMSRIIMHMRKTQRSTREKIPCFWGVGTVGCFSVPLGTWPNYKSWQGLHHQFRFQPVLSLLSTHSKFELVSCFDNQSNILPLISYHAVMHAMMLLLADERGSIARLHHVSYQLASQRPNEYALHFILRDQFPRRITLVFYSRCISDLPHSCKMPSPSYLAARISGTRPASGRSRVGSPGAVKKQNQGLPTFEKGC